MLTSLLTALIVVSAVMSPNNYNKINIAKERSLTVGNFGPLMCKENCLRILGCMAVKYHRQQLTCELLSYKIKSMNTLTEISRDDKLICNNNSNNNNEKSPFSTLLIVIRGRRPVCVYTGIKMPSRKPKQKATNYPTPQPVVASLDYSTTYYICAPNKLLKIEKQRDGSFKNIKIRAVNSCGRKSGPGNIVRGMTTAPCIYDRHGFCLYYLLKRKGRAKRTLKLNLTYYLEPNVYNIDGYTRMPSRSALLSCEISNCDPSHVVGVALDSEMNLYTLHRISLLKFEWSGKSYTTCKILRVIEDVDGVHAIHLHGSGSFMLIISHFITKIYDIKKSNKGGHELFLFKHSKHRLYCVDTVKNRVVIILEDDPRNVKFCDINIYKYRSKCD